MSAKMRPTSPRGTMPTPTTIRRNRDPGRGPAGGDLADDGEHGERRRDQRASPAPPARSDSSRPRLTEAPTLTKKIGVKIEATGRTSCSMVSNWLVPERMMPAANAPMMSADPASARAAARPEREGDGEDQQDIADPHADHEVEQPRRQEAPDQHGDHEKPDGHRERAQDTQHRRPRRRPRCPRRRSG